VGFRTLIYGGPALAVALLLTGGGPDEGTWLTGRTEQGHPFELLLEGDGRVGHLRTAFDTRCPGGMDHVRVFRVGPDRLDHNRLTVRTTTEHRFRLHDQTSHWIVEIDGRGHDGAIRGTATVVEHFDGPYWGAYTCESGDVTFSAG
jgi:hypothetical protein